MPGLIHGHGRRSLWTGALLLTIASMGQAAEPTLPTLTLDVPPSTLPAEPTPTSGLTAAPSLLQEDQPVGAYHQPVWVADRRFLGSRTYVIPEYEVETEYWTRADMPRHGPTEIQHMFEVEFGLPNRFQLDLYGIWRSEGDIASYFDQAIEMRYAFADWGKIWGNPALYLEYEQVEKAPDKGEVKLLLTDDLAPRWHWAQNVLFEAEISGQQEYEYGWTGGIAYTVIDHKLSVGAEAEFSLFDINSHRGTYRDETFLGPSIQYRPIPNMHIDIAPLLGITGESPAGKLFCNIGFEF